MGVIRDFIQQIIYVSIVAVIIELILPKGNTKKYVYVILSLFLFLNIVSPIINVIRDLDTNDIFDGVVSNISGNVSNKQDKSIEAFSQFKTSKVTNELRNTLSKDLKEKLKNRNIVFKDINIMMDEQYNLERLEIIIENLSRLGDKKNLKISETITMIANEYDIKEEKIIITEEAK